ncbi:histidine kinase [Nonomuraea monospora]|uniref:histidine kinase n=1 Tax=Nonomuraea monospora TaxID=568818 RepID=A0ABN3CX06_9ACTN
MLAVIEVRLDYFFDATATWVPGAVMGAGLMLAARYPLTGTLIAALSLPAGMIVFGAPGVSGAAMAGMIGAVVWTGWREPPRRSAVTLGLAAVSFASTALAGASAWELLFVPAILVPCWSVGLLARRGGEQAVRHADLAAHFAELAAALDAEREANAQAAVARERTRIAREVHDAVAHSVSVMTLQLGALRRLLGDRPAEQEVVAGLERLGRQTVEEMRGLVGLLRERVEGEQVAPMPSLVRLDELIADVRAAGLAVTLDVPADLPRLPPVLDVTAYRVLQEALTNVLRHAHAAPTAVAIGYNDQALTLEVRNAPPPAHAAARAGEAAAGGPAGGPRAGAAGNPAGGARAGAGGGPGGGVRAGVAGTSGGRAGHGLVGMRERLTMVQGSLQTGPEPDGGYAVRARFPLPRTW